MKKRMIRQGRGRNIIHTDRARVRALQMPSRHETSGGVVRVPANPGRKGSVLEYSSMAVKWRHCGSPLAIFAMPDKVDAKNSH